MKFIIFLIYLINLITNRKLNKNKNEPNPDSFKYFERGFDVRKIDDEHPLQFSSEPIFINDVNQITWENTNFESSEEKEYEINNTLDYKSSFGLLINIKSDFMGSALSAGYGYESKKNIIEKTNTKYFSVYKYFRKFQLKLKKDLNLSNNFKDDIEKYIGNRGSIIQPIFTNWPELIRSNRFNFKYDEGIKNCKPGSAYCLAAFFNKYGTHYLKSFSLGKLEKSKMISKESINTTDKSTTHNYGGEISHGIGISTNFKHESSSNLSKSSISKNLKMSKLGNDEELMPFEIIIESISELLDAEMQIIISLNQETYCLMVGVICEIDKVEVVTDLKIENFDKKQTEDTACKDGYTYVTPLMNNLHEQKNLIKDLKKSGGGKYAYLCQKKENLFLNFGVYNNFIYSESFRIETEKISNSCISSGNKFICFDHYQLGTTRKATPIFDFGIIKFKNNKKCQKYSPSLYPNYKCNCESINYNKDRLLCFSTNEKIN
jgi:hypothetical protein